MKLGIITNIPVDISTHDVVQLLKVAKVINSCELPPMITSVDAHAQKPDVKIYRCAATTVGASLPSRLSIGEEPDQIAGAILAGKSGIVKPESGARRSIPAAAFVR